MPHNAPAPQPRPAPPKPPQNPPPGPARPVVTADPTPEEVNYMIQQVSQLLIRLTKDLKPK